MFVAVDNLDHLDGIVAELRSTLGPAYEVTPWSDLNPFLRDVINRLSGSRRALSHGIVTPGAPGWLDEIDRVVATLRPDSGKNR